MSIIDQIMNPESGLASLPTIDTDTEEAFAPTQTDQELEAILVTDPFPDMSEEEILFWHSDYYDSIQEEKQAKQEAILKEKQVRNE